MHLQTRLTPSTTPGRRDRRWRGPAGCSTALALARNGIAVTILERSRYEAFRVGETLPPEARQFLTELGVWKQFLADGHLESPGIASSWGGPNLYENDFIVNPYGPGWHLDRRRFDLMLAHAAQASGVEVLRGPCDFHQPYRNPTSGGRASRRADRRIQLGRSLALPSPKAGIDFMPYPPAGGWGPLSTGNKSSARAAILVDATGRSSSIASRFGGRRIVYDRLVALVGLFQERSATAASDQRTIVETVECGWWYTAPLPRGLRIAAFLTDADLVPVGRRGASGCGTNRSSRHLT